MCLDKNIKQQLVFQPTNFFFEKNPTNYLVPLHLLLLFSREDSAICMYMFNRMQRSGLPSFEKKTRS